MSLAIFSLGCLMGIVRGFINHLLSGRGARDGDSAIKVNGYQIVYNAATRLDADPEFDHLDNTGCERADWFEYWPIQKFLKNNALSESEVYGFLSTKFSTKTGLSGAEILRFMESSRDVDVYTFSPFPQHGAFFRTVFEQGQFFDPDFFKTASDFFKIIDPELDLRRMVNHSENVIYSNFFFAKPRFWRDWLRVCDRLFEVCEENGHLREKLCQEIVYTTSDGKSKIVQRKVFVMERVASYLLTQPNNYTVVNYPIWKMPLFEMPVELIPNIYAMDDLKKLYANTLDPDVLEKYKNEQRRVIPRVWPGASCAFIE